MGHRSAAELRPADLYALFWRVRGEVERLAPDEFGAGRLGHTEQCLDVVVGELIVVITRSDPRARAQV